MATASEPHRLPYKRRRRYTNHNPSQQPAKITANLNDNDVIPTIRYNSFYLLFMDNISSQTAGIDNSEEPEWIEEATLIDNTTYSNRHDAAVALTQLQVPLIDDDVYLLRLETEYDRLTLYFTFAFDCDNLDRIRARFVPEHIDETTLLRNYSNLRL